MATKINNSEKITLHDGTVVDIHPLNIKALRGFMAIAKQFSEQKSEDEGLDLMLEASFLALNACNKNRFESVEDLEELIDITIINKIFEVSAGVDLTGGGNPNPIPQAG